MIPLLKNLQQPSFYYLPLKGIAIGRTHLQIPISDFALQDDDTSNVIIDASTSITYLEVAEYQQMKRAFLNHVQLSVADGSNVVLNICFLLQAESSSVEVQKLRFNFKGSDLDFPIENYIITDSSINIVVLDHHGIYGLVDH